MKMEWKTILLFVSGLYLSVPTAEAQWQTLGSDIYFDSGNVGIGNANPASLLDVSGELRTDTLLINGQLLFTNGYEQLLSTDASPTFSGATSDGNTTISTGWLHVTDNFARFDNRVGIGVPPYGPSRIGDNDLQVDGSIDVNGSYGFVNTDKTSNWRLYPSGVGPLVLNIKTFSTPYAVMKVSGDAVSDPSTDDSEATLALYRGNLDGSDSEFIDIYNNGYGSSRQYGLRIQKRGTGQYRPFAIEFSDGSTTTEAMKINTDLSSEFAGDIMVDGTTHSEEVIVTENVGADFVFAEEYNLPALEEVEAHIREHRHLPGVPSAKEMIREGVNVGALQMKLLQKIEELTLHTIEQQKFMTMQQEKITQLENELNRLKNNN